MMTLFTFGMWLSVIPLLRIPAAEILAVQLLVWNLEVVSEYQAHERQLSWLNLTELCNIVGSRRVHRFSFVSMEVSAALKAVRKGTNEMKTATLLRYTANLARFAAGRVSGRAPSSALRNALVADWVALEKARPLERRLRTQLDTLAAGAREDAPAHRPNAAAMVGASDSESDDS
eukprot:IDg5811t1